MDDFNVGNYILKDKERYVIKLIDEHNMQGFITKYNDKLIHAYDRQSISKLFPLYYNFFSYCMMNDYLYVLYHILKNYPDVVNEYFHYESDDLWLKNRKDVSEKYCGSEYSSKSLIHYITSEIKKTADSKNDTNFYILLELLDLATDMPNVHYFMKKSRYNNPPDSFEYIVDHVLFALALFNYDSYTYKKVIYKLLCVDRSLMFHSNLHENHTIVYTKNPQYLTNYLSELLKGHVSVCVSMLIPVTVDNLHISNLIRDHLHNKEKGNLIHLYENKDSRIYIHSENKLFDDNCLKWIYNTDDIENINGDILVKIILWTIEIIGCALALDTIDKVLTDINFKDNEEDVINKEKSKYKIIWINTIKRLIMDSYSSDICSLIVLVSDNFLKF